MGGGKGRLFKLGVTWRQERCSNLQSALSPSGHGIVDSSLRFPQRKFDCLEKKIVYQAKTQKAKFKIMRHSQLLSVAIWPCSLVLW